MLDTSFRKKKREKKEVSNLFELLLGGGSLLGGWAEGAAEQLKEHVCFHLNERDHTRRSTDSGFTKGRAGRGGMGRKGRRED